MCPNLQVSSVQFTVFFIRLFIEYSFPQTFTVYQNIAISLLAMFGELFTGLLLTIFWDIVLKINRYFPDLLSTATGLTLGAYISDFKPFLPG